MWGSGCRESCPGYSLSAPALSRGSHATFQTQGLEVVTDGALAAGPERTRGASAPAWVSAPTPSASRSCCWIRSTVTRRRRGRGARPFGARFLLGSPVCPKQDAGHQQHAQRAALVTPRRVTSRGMERQSAYPKVRVDSSDHEEREPHMAHVMAQLRPGTNQDNEEEVGTTRKQFH